jgi:hypothetical protein
MWVCSRHVCVYVCPVVLSSESVLRLLLGSDYNEVVFTFWCVPRLLPDNNEMVFSFWSVRWLLPEGGKVRCYLFSERPPRKRQYIGQVNPNCKRMK